MANGEVCCLLKVCCEPGDPDAFASAFVNEFTHDHPADGSRGHRPDGAGVGVVARWVFENFDLAPKGSLDAYREAILKHAKKK